MSNYIYSYDRDMAKIVDELRQENLALLARVDELQLRVVELEEELGIKWEE